MSKWVEVKMNDKLKNFIKSGGKQMEQQADKAMMELGILGESKAKIEQTAVKTGRLRTSLHWENDKAAGYIYSDNTGRSFSGSFGDKPQQGEVKIGTNVEYALNIENRLGYMQKT
jgi:hypothetical protein